MPALLLSLLAACATGSFEVDASSERPSIGGDAEAACYYTLSMQRPSGELEYRVESWLVGGLAQEGSVDFDGNGSVDWTFAFTYDDAGRLQTEQVSVGGVSPSVQLRSYRYDASGRVGEVTLDSSSDGVIDAREWLTYETDGAASLTITDYDRDADGWIDDRRTVADDPEAMERRWLYDDGDDGVIDDVVVEGYNTWGDLESERYDDDADGRIDAANRYHHDYDGAGRLLETASDYGADGAAEVRRVYDWLPSGKLDRYVNYRIRDGVEVLHQIVDYDWSACEYAPVTPLTL